MRLRFVFLCSLVAASGVCAADLPPNPLNTGISVPDPTVGATSGGSDIEDGKALYENGQMIAALGKFMTVLRSDPRNEEARQYLRLIIDAMRQDPAISAKSMGKEQAVMTSPAVQEEIRRMLQMRSRLTLDLRAIPGVRVEMKGNVHQVSIETPLFFSENSGGLKEQGIPILDRVAAWLKTYGQQPILIHSYPEELLPASAGGALFLRRYSELFTYFVEERHLPPTRFVSADLMTGAATPSAAGMPKADDIQVSTSTPRVVIETVGSQPALMEAMPSASSNKNQAQWVENSLVLNKKLFNPEEGEWVNVDVAALSRGGLKSWMFTITPVEGNNGQSVMKVEGTGNLLRRLSWDGHDQQTGNFVRAGQYKAKLVAVNADKTIKTQEDFLQVERTTKEEPVVVEKPKPPAVKKPKAKKAKNKATGNAMSSSSPAVAGGPVDLKSQGNGTTGALGDDGSGVTPAPAAEASEDSAHAIWKQVIQFDANQSDLAPTVKSSLERIGKTLEVYPLQKVRITGFAMESEQNPSALAKKRADVVRSILVEEYHVDAKRVIISGGKTTSSENGSKVEMSITN